MSALHYRNRTGRGQRIDLALLDSLLVAMDNLGERYTVGGERLTRAGNVSFGGSSSGSTPTTDGHVAIAAGASNAVWTRFCEIIGRGDLARDPRFATAAARRDRRDEVAAIIAGWTGQRTRAEVVDILAGGGVPGGAGQRRGRDDRRPAGAGARDVRRGRASDVRPADHDRDAAQDVRDPGPHPLARPEPGAHNEEVFVGMLGHSREDLARWQAEGVI